MLLPLLPNGRVNMAHSLTPLPIDALSPEVDSLWKSGQNAVLSAPTGSGKSTRMPQLLAKLAGPEKTILVLQPRRVAARMLARRVAEEWQTRLGEAVGYHIRHDRKATDSTRIIFLTEGILLRRLQRDPHLNGVAAVIFDEFHERHLAGDVGLAMVRRLQRKHRADLRLIVMSATLSAEGLQDYLAPARTLSSDGRTFPVEIAYTKASEIDSRAPIWKNVASAFRREARNGFEGDCLIFMPGAFEIRKTIEAIEALPESRLFEVLRLHGEQSADEQDRAFNASKRPKIIVSTNIAETSLTLPEVRLVIDGGLARIAGYDARRGLNTLLVEPISRASADQRAGRAGRVAPGRCLRLWTQSEHSFRPAFLAPEIHRLELAETLLGLHAAGVQSITTLEWFDPPNDERVQEAEELLTQLAAIDPEKGLTSKGADLARLPLHPRLGSLVLEAARLKQAELGCLLAGLLESRSIFDHRVDRSVEKRRDALLEPALDLGSDHLALILAWQGAEHARFSLPWGKEHGIKVNAAREAARSASQLISALKELGQFQAERSPLTNETLQRILLAGFADNVAKRLNRQNYSTQTARGRRGDIDRKSLARSADWVVATELQERTIGKDVSVFLTQNTPINPTLLKECFEGQFTTQRETRLEGSQGRIVTVTEERFRELVISSKEADQVDTSAAAGLLAEAVRRGDVVLKEWTLRVDEWISRVNFLARACPDYGFSPFTEEDKQLVIEQLCFGAKSFSEIKKKPVMPLLEDWLPAGLAPEVTRLAPRELNLGERKRFRVRYPEAGSPIVSGQLQKFYDLPHATFAIAEGRVLPRVELLAPNQRPAQLTDDLDAFWQGSYEAVKKELRGRYPKHEWR